MTSQVSQNCHIADIQTVNNDLKFLRSNSEVQSLFPFRKEKFKSRKLIYSRMFRDRHSSTQFNGASLPSAAERRNSDDKFPAYFLQKYKYSALYSINSILTMTLNLVYKTRRILNTNFCLNNHFVEL